ncbi:MAG TPA: lipopolysaccharide assembly protein LapA domain-containing protein [Micromonosporaceae bacterium]|nr:lipopolysaccharide assembly protein LapA domain-containing protein [Micromonosporaceae bacterium]
MTQPPTGPDDRRSGRRRPTWTGNRSRSTRTRAGSVWFAVILFAIVLLLLLIFILQNSQQVRISFFGAHGEVPQGVALLLAAVFGILLVALPGTARIIQLHRRHRAAARAASGSQPPETAPTPGYQPTTTPPDDQPTSTTPPGSAMTQPGAASPGAAPPGLAPPSTDQSSTDQSAPHPSQDRS